MNIYDEANNFAKSLKECPEVIALKNANEKVKKNSTNKKMVDDFRKMQIQAYSEQVQKGEVSKELKDKFQNMGSIISMNPDVSEYLQAEQKFAMIWQDIMKILNEAVDIDFGVDKSK